VSGKPWAKLGHARPKRLLDVHDVHAALLMLPRCGEPVPVYVKAIARGFSISQRPDPRGSAPILAGYFCQVAAAGALLLSEFHDALEAAAQEAALEYRG
jgi:hypothetical protein